jgi:galactokinase
MNEDRTAKFLVVGAGGIGRALAELAGLTIAPAEIAMMAQAGECDHVGMRCGIMDQLASACGTQGHALMIDCRSLAVRPVALPAPPAAAAASLGSSVKVGAPAPL